MISFGTGSGEIDKKIDPKLTHISDALGYYIARKFPTTRTETATVTLSASRSEYYV